MTENARFVRFRWHHLQDERKSLIRCTDILCRIVIFNVSSSCTALGVPERANLLSNSCENPPGMVLLPMKSRRLVTVFFFFSFSASPTSSTLTRPMNKLFKRILRPSLQKILSDRSVRVCVGLQASATSGKTYFTNLPRVDFIRSQYDWVVGIGR